jgi:Sulfotransferase family
VCCDKKRLKAEGRGMIISHSRRFIFIKTKKTAGTSLEIALSKYCGRDDILAPLVDYDEKARLDHSGMRAQNYQKPFISANFTERVRMLFSQNAVPLFREHLPAADARKLIGRDIWDSYLKFTVVRNPYDRMISRYFWTLNNGKKAAERYKISSFNQYLRYYPEHINENWNIYTAGDELLVDEVARYENLEKDLGRISAAIDLSHNLHDDLKKIKAKSGIRPKHVDVEALIGPDEAALIGGLCSKEIETFDYRFKDVLARQRPAAPILEMVAF